MTETEESSVWDMGCCAFGPGALCRRCVVRHRPAFTRLDGQTGLGAVDRLAMAAVSAESRTEPDEDQAVYSAQPEPCYRLCPSMRQVAVVFKPETLVRWHRS